MEKILNANAIPLFRNAIFSALNVISSTGYKFEQLNECRINKTDMRGHLRIVLIEKH